MGPQIIFGAAVSISGLFATACVAADTNRFDLYCTAKNVLTGEAITPFEYHVDLAQKQWCDDDFHKCGANPHALLVTPDRLWMQVSDTSTGSAGWDTMESWVFRQTGAFHFRHEYQGSRTLQFEGTCERKPYGSGPKNLF